MTSETGLVCCWPVKQVCLSVCLFDRKVYIVWASGRMSPRSLWKIAHERAAEILHWYPAPSSLSVYQTYSLSCSPCLSVRLPNFLIAGLPVSVFLCLPVCVCLSLCLSMSACCLSVCVCLPACLPVHLCLSVCLSICAQHLPKGATRGQLMENTTMTENTMIIQAYCWPYANSLTASCVKDV